MLKNFFCLPLLLWINNSFAQAPDWPAIKSTIVPEIMDTNEYGTPYIQPHHNTGWEDGMFISRDGLQMYAFYFPADLVLFSSYLSLNPICPSISQFIRGPLLGVDTITNLFGCSSILHSDIIYTSRVDTSFPFDPWQSSNLANPGEFEGGPQSLMRADGSLDAFVYTISNNSQTDIYWFRDTVNNPTGPGTKMPFPVNDSTFSEDNPHLERINDSTFVLMLDNHAAAGDTADIYYTMSTDNGASWLPKTLVSSVNTATEDIHPHLWNDGNDWWLYFATIDSADIHNRLSIFRMKQSIPGDFNSWINRELIISPGISTDGSGFPAAVGEPSLTKWGDISFVLAIAALGTTDTTDRFELDPWYLPRKSPIVTGIKDQLKEETVIVYPNPATKSITLNTKQKGSLSIFNLSGQAIYKNISLAKGDNTLFLDLIPQVYLLTITTQNEQINKKLIVK